jgi:hypothetical protein
MTCSRSLGQHSGVPVSRAAWLAVVGICALAVLLLAVNGYAGYAIVLGAVGVSAAVNLF